MEEINSEENTGSKDPQISSNKSKQSLHPNNLLQNIFLGFLYKILRTGSKQPFQFSMLYQVDPKLFTYRRACSSFIQKASKTLSKGKHLNYWFFVNQAGPLVYPTMIQSLISHILQLILPLLLERLIRWLMTDDADNSLGFYYFGYICAILVVNVLLNRRTSLLFFHTLLYVSNLVSVRIFTLFC